jgi:predicted HNH restriction endonuclease
MNELTIEQYQDAIKILNDRQIKALQALYSQPEHTATAETIAKLLNPVKPAPVIASGRIGKIGKAFADFHNIAVSDYYGNSENPAFVTFVSPLYRPKVGWTMYNNLKIAFENLGMGTAGEVIERLTTEAQPYEEEELYHEGKLIQVFVNKYERNQKPELNV